MSPGRLPYTVEVVERADTVTGRAGLPLVLETVRALGLDQAIADHVHVRERQSGYPETEKVEALVLLLAAGGDCLDDIRVLQADAGLTRLLGRRFPSADTLRHFVSACHDDQWILQAQAPWPPDRVASIPAETAALQGLAHVTTALVHRVAAEGHDGHPRPRRHDPGEPHAGGPPALPGRPGVPARGHLLGGAGPRAGRRGPGTGPSRPVWRRFP